MKLFLLYALTLLTVTLQAQPAKPAGKIAVGFNLSPDYSYRTLKNNDGAGSTNFVIESRNHAEIAKPGFTTGFTLAYACSGTLGFQTGVQYSNKGYKTQSRDLVFTQTDPALPTKVKTGYVYQYIGIPVNLKFTTGNGKILFVGGMGFMTNFLLSAKNIMHYQYASGKTESKSSLVTSQLNKIDFSPMLSAGVGYKISSEINLQVEPTFRYALLPTVDAPVTEHLWSGGVNISLTRKWR